MSNGGSGYLDIDFSAPKADRVGKLLEVSFGTFFGNFGSILKIVLAVFLPLELIKNYWIYAVEMQENAATVFRVDSLLGSVFGALVTPALIFSIVTKLRTGTAPPIGESFSWGGRQWGRTFGNRLLAGAAMLGGAILFIIPGVVLAIWFVFVDAIVGVEGDRQRHVLARSRILTEGHRWMIFFAGCILFLFLLLVGVIGCIPFVLVDHWITSAVADISMVVGGQIFVVTFLMAYLSITESERLPDVFD